MVEDAHLDPLQMVLVGTVLEASVFLFEIPTGVMADRYSRKWSVVVGHFGMGIGFLLLALVPSFYAILVSSLIWGASYTFVSGAYPAWLSGEVGTTKAGEAFLRGSQLGHVGSFVGIAAAVWLAHTSLALPIAIGALGFVVLSVAMALLMEEQHFEPAMAEERDTWAGLKSTFIGGVSEIRARPVLVTILAITLVYGMFSEGVDRLFTPLLLGNYQLPMIGQIEAVAWWGVIAAVAHVVGLVVTTLVRRYVKLHETRQLTLVMGASLVGAALFVLALAIANTLLLSLLCYWAAQGCRSAYGPLMTAWLNRLLPETGKATLFSMYGQADAIGQTVGGPIVGVVAKQASIAIGMAMSASLLLPSSFLFRRTQKQLADD